MPRRKKQPEPSNEYKPCCPWCDALAKSEPWKLGEETGWYVTCLHCGLDQRIETDSGALQAAQKAAEASQKAS